VNNPDGAPALPENSKLRASSEMTLRDWYAGLAMQGDWASQSPTAGEFVNENTVEHLKQRTALYYRAADAMLAQRESQS
jgi:hypothetical protein